MTQPLLDFDSIGIGTPPPIENFSADKFRQWKAGIISAESPTNETDRDEAKRVIIDFLCCCSELYGLDALTKWERIGNGLVVSWEKCSGDLLQWINHMLAYIEASHSRVAASKSYSAILAEIDSKSEAWRVECVAMIMQLRFVLPSLAQSKWKLFIEAKQAEKAASNGDQ